MLSRQRTIRSGHRIQVECLDWKFELGNEFLHRLFDRCQGPFSINFVRQDFVEHEAQIFERNVLVFAEPRDVGHALHSNRSGQVIQEEPGLLTGTIPHVGGVEIHARPVCLEKLLDGLTLLVEAVYLMTVQVGPVSSNRDGSHLGNRYEKLLQVLGLEFVHLLVRKPADTLLTARQFELRLSVFLCIYAFRPLGGISELVGVELGVVIHENVEAVLFYFEGLDCPSVVEEKVGIALRRQRQMRLHEAAPALDRDDIEEVLLRERFELLLRCEAFVGNHRVLVARDAALGEHVGERADVGCASEELLVVHGITAVIAEAVDVKQVYLWLEAALRVVA